MEKNIENLNIIIAIERTSNFHSACIHHLYVQCLLVPYGVSVPLYSVNTLSSVCIFSL